MWRKRPAISGLRLPSSYRTPAHESDKRRCFHVVVSNVGAMSPATPLPSRERKYHPAPVRTRGHRKSRKNTKFSSVVWGRPPMPVPEEWHGTNTCLRDEYYANTQSSPATISCDDGQILTNDGKPNTIDLSSGGGQHCSSKCSVRKHGRITASSLTYYFRHDPLGLPDQQSTLRTWAPVPKFATDLHMEPCPTFRDCARTDGDDAHDCSLSKANSWLKDQRLIR